MGKLKTDIPSDRMIPMLPFLREIEKGEAKVEHFEVESYWAAISSIRGDNIPEGKYVRLMINGQLYMSDTYEEKKTNLTVVRRAHGRVLIAGLGLGVILVPMLHNPEVKEIVVVEKSKGVIDAVEHQLRREFLEASEKLKVINDDIFKWRPEKGEKFNVLYFDIWKDICVDNLKEMAKLHRIYWRYKDKEDPQVYMDSWNCDLLKYQRERDRRAGWNW